MDFNGHSFLGSLSAAECGYRVITYDRSNSSQPSSGYDYDTFAADLNTLMTSLTCKIPCWLFQWGQVKLRATWQVWLRTVQKGANGLVPPFLLKTNDNPER